MTQLSENVTLRLNKGGGIIVYADFGIDATGWAVEVYDPVHVPEGAISIKWSDVTSGSAELRLHEATWPEGRIANFQIRAIPPEVSFHTDPISSANIWVEAMP